MEIKAGILLDLGNSETRLTLLTGGKCIPMTLSNRFAQLDNNYKIPREYSTNDKSRVFCYNNIYWANGALADREFAVSLMRPSATQMKTGTIIGKLTLNLAFIVVLEELAKMNNVEVSDIKATFNVSVLLPPLEHSVQSSAMEEEIRSIKEVVSFIPKNYRVAFDIDEVKVYPEGVASFFGVYFKEADGTLIESDENKMFGTGIVLILDIGAGTTDLVLIKDTELLVNSKETFAIGGNTVRAALKKLVKTNYNYSATDSVLDAAIQTGLLEQGAKMIDVSQLITEAKRDYSLNMRNQLQTYIEAQQIDPASIKGLLVVGGGSLATENEGKVVSPSMANILVDYLNDLAPNIGLVSLLGQNPRLLNIVGLKYIHKYA